MLEQVGFKHVMPAHCFVEILPYLAHRRHIKLKRSPSRKIDLAVAASMAIDRCLYLNI